MGKETGPDRTVIVTGATGTMGSTLTLALARRQCRVIMACRNLDKCKEIRREIVLVTKNKSIACRHLDLESIDSINKFVDDICKNEPHIDILVNNAAVRNIKKKELTQYGFERHLFVNFLAPYLLTMRLMPKLEESSKITHDSRVINVIGAPKKYWKVDLTDINFDRRKYNHKQAYWQSKMALAYFTILLEKFNREKGNKVYVFGTSPNEKRIAPSFFHETGIIQELVFNLGHYFSVSARLLSEVPLRCALDKSLANEAGSGRLYNFFLRSWGRNKGWGPAIDEVKAKFVWNHAADLLVNIPVKPNDNRDGNQEKLQANNKASGVEESA